jgi:hypothetical protein
MIAGLFTILPLFLGIMLIAAAAWEFMTWRTRFSDWADGMATSLGAVKNQGDVGPRLAYEYVIDGTAYEGLSVYMNDSLPEKGEGIHIYYDPSNPGNSEWYDGGMHKFFMYGVGLIGVFIVWLAL